MNHDEGDSIATDIPIKFEFDCVPDKEFPGMFEFTVRRVRVPVVRGIGDVT